MGRLFALADLHLSLGGDKPMDVFGPLWSDHTRRMAEAWDARVGGDDTVLLPGDLRGQELEEARPDLEWIGARPGRKLLLRGNHDGWWSSLAAVRRALPAAASRCRHALEAEGWVIVGARGWTAPDDPAAEPADAAVFARGWAGCVFRRRCRPALRAAHAAAGHAPLPPRSPGALDGGRTDPGRGRRSCVVDGHLHGDDHRLAVRGVRDGIELHFVAADAVGFTPVPLDAPPS